MKFTIFYINDDRKAMRESIINRCKREYVRIPAVDGSNEDLVPLLKEFNLEDSVKHHHRPYRKGELGIWLTVLRAVKWCAENEEALLTFEDDAVIQTDFNSKFESRLEHLPEDFDFLSLFVPRDHYHWYGYEKELDENGYVIKGMARKIGQSEPNPYWVNSFICKTWQRYGGVSMLYSPDGAKKILKLIDSEGISWQYDEWMYRHQRLGNLNGYAFHPGKSDIVRTKPCPTIIHRTEMFEWK